MAVPADEFIRFSVSISYPKVFIVFATAASSVTATGKKSWNGVTTHYEWYRLKKPFSSNRAGKIYRDRYEALTASFLWECPSAPRPHDRNPGDRSLCLFTLTNTS